MFQELNPFMRLLHTTLLIVTGTLLITILFLKTSLQTAREDLEHSEQRMRRLSSDMEKQQAYIKQKDLVNEHYHQIAENFETYHEKLSKEAEDNQAAFRAENRTVAAGHECIPADIAQRLYEYTNRLRSGSLSPATGNTDQSGSDPTSTACRLTYGQVLYWTEYLLSALDEANQKLKSIKHAEREAQEITSIHEN